MRIPRLRIFGTAAAAADTNISCSTDALTLTTYTATISYLVPVNISCSTDALTLTTYKATVALGAGASISCGVHNLVLTTYQATIDGRIATDWTDESGSSSSWTPTTGSGAWTDISGSSTTWTNK
jgi:hypothetical protein